VYEISNVFERLLYVSNNIIYQNFVCCCGLYSQRCFSFSNLMCLPLLSVWDVWGALIQPFHIWAAIHIYCYWYKTDGFSAIYVAACVEKRYDNDSQHRNLTLCFELAHYIASFTGYWLDIKLESDWRKHDKWSVCHSLPNPARVRQETGWLADHCSVLQQLGALQTHSSSFLTQRTYSYSNFIAISSLVLELLKKCRVR